MSILSLMYDKRDCATAAPCIISAGGDEGELSRLQGRARCIVAHPDRLRVTELPVRISGVCRALGIVHAAVYTSRAGQQRRHVHRHRRCPTIMVSTCGRRGSALPAHTDWGTLSWAMSAGMISCREPSQATSCRAGGQRVCLACAAALTARAAAFSRPGHRAAVRHQPSGAEFGWSRMPGAVPAALLAARRSERLWYMRNSRIIKGHRLRGVGQPGVFPGGDLFVAQFLLNIKEPSRPAIFTTFLQLDDVDDVSKIIAVTIWVIKSFKSILYSLKLLQSLHVRIFLRSPMLTLLFRKHRRSFELLLREIVISAQSTYLFAYFSFAPPCYDYAMKYIPPK